MAKNFDSVLLYGGGIDSTTLLFFLQQQGINPLAMYFEYGQKAQRLERLSLERWVPESRRKIFSIDLKALVTSNIMAGENLASTPASNALEGRNLIFISLASAYASSVGARVLYLGFHAEPESAPFPDATEGFRLAVNTTLAAGMLNPITVEAPFSSWTRKEIFAWALKNAPEALEAHTCYEDVSGGCGKCSHCLLKKELLSCVE